MSSYEYDDYRETYYSQRNTEHIEDSLDSLFMLNSGSLVFFILFGFCMRCAGSVRKKNAKSVVVVFFLAASVGAICYYLFGYAFAFGEGGGTFIGFKNFALHKSHTSEYMSWFFLYALVATVPAIVSGAVAERMKIEAQLLSTFILTSWVCPVIMRWIWGYRGWLSMWNEDDAFFDLGMIDYAGSGVFHLVGGVAALSGTLVVGSRLGRFDANGKPCEIAGYSVTIASLGVFILWYAWYGINAGSVFTLQDDGYLITPRCAVTTTLSAAASCFSSLAFLLIRNYIAEGCLVWDVIGAGNGILAGLVAISASCAVIRLWSAIVIGLVAGFIYTQASYFILHVLKLDDPVDAIAIHGVCGAWGLIGAAAFADDGLLAVAKYGANASSDAYGFFMGDNGRYLVAAIVGILVITGWVLVHMILLFLILKHTGLLRVSAAEEYERLDEDNLAENGNLAVPPSEATRQNEVELTQIHTDNLRHQDEEIESLKAKIERLEAIVHTLTTTNTRT